jgi:biotin carboxylase
MNKYVAFLGGNTMAMPSVERLKMHGYKVIIIDRKPCEKAYEIADLVIVADIMKPKEVIDAVKNHELCAVMPINDFGIETASKLSIERKLPGLSEEAALNVTSKRAMKESWLKANLSTPIFQKFKLADVINGLFNWDNFPAIVKPSFAGGASRGVFKVNSKNEITEHVLNSQQFYLHDDVIVEEFISGTEHTVEAILYKGKSHIISISDKKNYSFSATVVQQLYFPGPIGNEQKGKIDALIQDACVALGIETGCVHFEIIITTKRIYLLEVGGRPGGGLNFFPIGFLSTGYDYPLEYVRVLTGEPPLLKKNGETFQLGWFFLETPTGILKEVRGMDEIKKHPNVVVSEILLPVGTKLNANFKNDMERPVYFLVKAKDKVTVDKLINELQEKVKIIVE